MTPPTTNLTDTTDTTDTIDTTNVTNTIDTTTVILDYREKKLIDGFNKLNKCILIENLAIGDIVIKKNDNIQIIIERKTETDLAASITDGRWREQKQRLLNSNSKILYIIEKQPWKSLNINHKTIKSAILNTLLRDQCSVFYTNNVQETIETINIIADKIDKNEFTNNISPIIEIKKRNKIMENVFLHQLNAIPGVSIKIAEKIQEHYKNWKELITELEQHHTQNLQNISLGNKKLGKKLAEKIYDSLKLT